MVRNMHDIDRSELEDGLVGFKVFVDKLPVDHSAEVFDVLGSGVAVVDVVGMFPDVNGQQRLIVVSEGVTGIRGVEDSDVVLVLGKPGPP